MAGCKLTLLGGFALESGNGTELPLSTRKDKLLLAYLALSAGRAQSREKLAGLLWGDRAETQARDSLRQSLAAIRQAFRQVNLDPLRADRESVTFEPAGIDIDALEFPRLAAEAGANGRAAALYRGELLDGIEATTLAFEEWLRPERERLGELAVRVLEQLVHSSPVDDIAAEAARLGRLLLARDHLLEPVYRALMRLHALKGDRAEALKIYATCRDALRKELDVAPDLKTEELYRDILTDRPAPPAGPPEGERAPDRPSIAVLPFDNLGGDIDLGHLCEGISEDIITGLGRFRLLFVIDRHSSSSVAAQTSDVEEIGRRLGVAYVVQGSLQRLGERLRITVRLVDCTSRAQRWGEAYDYALADIVSAPDKITGAIVTTLQARVEISLLEQSRRKPKLAAYECLLRGIKHLRGYAPDDNRRAVDLFQQAIDLDPEYALARAYRGFADVVLHGYDETPDDILAGALAMASSAIELDNDDARCHWILGLIHSYRGDLKHLEQHIQRAIALNPNDASAISTQGSMLAILGRPEEGIDRIREAMRRNPYHPEWYWIALGNALYLARRHADALEAYRHLTRPRYWALARIAACCAQSGRMDEARAAAAEVLRLRPDVSFVKLRGTSWNEADTQHLREGMRKAGLPV